MGLRAGEDEYQYVVLSNEYGMVDLFNVNKAVKRERKKPGKALPPTERNLYSSLKIITESIEKRHKAVEKLLEIEDEKYVDIAEIQLATCMELEELKSKVVEQHGVKFFCGKSDKNIKFSDAVKTLESYLNL